MSGDRFADRDEEREKPGGPAYSTYHHDQQLETIPLMLGSNFEDEVRWP